MFKVKLTLPYPNWPIGRQTPGWKPNWSTFFPLKWGNFQFYVNDIYTTECDYWVIFEGLLFDENVKCDKKNIIFIGGECTGTGTYSAEFLDQFGKVITCQDRITHSDKTLFHTANPWFVGKTYDELIASNLVPKSKNISIICSNKQFTDGHKKRYDFCMKLKDYFGSDIDLFGRGIKDFEDKWEVLSEYKYSIAIENYVEPNWFTEKLYDCFLAHTIPFYYGCPNVDNYFSKDSYIGIDLENFEHSKIVIEKTLNNNSNYQAMLPSVIESKIKYLDHYNIFPVITNFILAKKLLANNSLTTNYVCLNPQSNNQNVGKSLIRKFKKKIKGIVKL